MTKMGDNEAELSSDDPEFRQREAHHQDQMKAAEAARKTSRNSVFVGASAVCITLLLTGLGYCQSTKEFKASSRDDHYNQIIDGLDSEALP